MNRCEVSVKCCRCDGETEYCEMNDNGSMSAICWLCKVERGKVATSRIREILIDGDVGRVDLGRASGLCVCDDCGKTYYRHKANGTYPFLVQLCSGALAK